MILLSELFKRQKPAPAEWFEGIVAPVDEVNYALPPLQCENYAELREYWKKAMLWTDSMDDTLTFMLSIVASTKQQGSQIWGRVIGLAGSAKTMLCEGICANGDYCYPLSLVTGFHSGYVAGGEDESMVLRLNGKTAVVNEGDMLLKAPNLPQSMAELRDLWSGRASCDFKNGKHERYEGLRITFILAGTSTLRQLNKSALGDRFLDCVIYERDRAKLGTTNEHESDIVRAAIRKQRVRSRVASDGRPESYDEPEKIEAKQRTAGFIQYLRENAESIASQVDASITDSEWDKLEMVCHDLAHLVAWMRTRPSGSGEEPTEPELATRLGEQLYRFCLYNAVVLGTGIDEEVLRRVAKYANDTCYGNTFSVCKALMERPLDAAGLSAKLGIGAGEVMSAVSILRDIGCVKNDILPAVSGALGRGKGVYRLSPYVAGLLVRLRELMGKEVSEVG